MKLIIDISEDVYKKTVFYREFRDLNDCVTTIKALEKGTPLSESEDCVSRQAVLDAIDAEAWAFCDYLIREGRNEEQKPVSHFSDNLRERISDNEALPPVNPTEKVGRWIERFDIIGKWYECDQCHTDWGCSANYCPDCGAKMASPTGAEGSDKE